MPLFGEFVKPLIECDAGVIEGGELVLRIGDAAAEAVGVGYAIEVVEARLQ